MRTWGMGRKSAAYEDGCGFQCFHSLLPTSASASTENMLGWRALPHTCSAEALKVWLEHPPGDVLENELVRTWAVDMSSQQITWPLWGTEGTEAQIINA